MAFTGALKGDPQATSLTHRNHPPQTGPATRPPRALSLVPPPRFTQAPAQVPRRGALVEPFVGITAGTHGCYKSFLYII